ncbi:orotidine-5'-phosphate decarboxylase [bacterium]|nr:orotidine-5'-phosphate decarboxylase [bacterium]NIN92831.1 orotidine-5'-phosphate decarboxylase [bacterium]NIO18786.1 orotidine-5'-phosphate decarboxylase [bacterium]NIO73867.1 orotidine-5'-phosphate decarboxylase [bacterium]
MSEKLIVALDVEEMEKAENLVDSLIPYVKLFKVGSFLFTACGPKILGMVVKKGGKVFLDLKYFDIPNVVSNSVKMAQTHGVFSLTLSILGGRKMLEAAASIHPRPLLWGVTILTSIDSPDMNELGISREIGDEVVSLAKIAESAGLEGVVASPLEIEIIRKATRKDFIIVTPGIRPVAQEKSSGDDQKRVMAPGEALKRGADYIVVGRPIIEAPNPVAAVKAILQEMEK